MYRVILADDEKYVLKSLRASVNWEQLGLEIVYEATGGSDAYQSILRLEPHLVVTDIRMPGMSGLALVQQVKERLPLVQFVVISGYAEFEYVKTALEHGVVGYCLKPLDREELTAAVQKAVVSLERACRLAEEQGENPLMKKQHSEKMTHVLRYIDAHYQQALSLNEVAGKLYLNANYISQLFKKELGMTFTEYVTGKKMEHAKRLLSANGVSIAQIAGQLGYNDYFYFLRVFKKATGMSPGEYRERQEHQLYRHQE